MKEVIKQRNGTIYKYVHCGCGRIHVYEKRKKVGFTTNHFWYLVGHISKEDYLLNETTESTTKVQ